ncbi:MAG: excinuclease ABC subunit UvrB [Candidatus Pacebacteria bacterium]|nr:excinuclease ABC subunit UvrB [Candidatus Paceibacterota bacterium]
MSSPQGTFTLHAPFEPAGDQPDAITALVAGVKKGMRHQTLLGATGTGKTYTIANVIAQIQKPTLVIAHNKTLAAQLAQEYREFFPENAVHYFVSYYDFYQPEAYMPISDTYIEKEAMVNKEIERLRHASTQALLTRRDVIVVASVSCIYGLGSPKEYERVHLKLARGATQTRSDLVRELVRIHFSRTNADLEPGLFRARGNMIEVMPTNERVIYRIGFDALGIATIEEIDAITRAIRTEHELLYVFPAKHFITSPAETKRAVKDIQAELAHRLAELESHGKVLEHERLKRRTGHDLALIKEVGYCNGIENYSRHFDGRKAGEPASTLLSYFPHHADGSPDFLTIIDESHVTVPQLGGMYAGDRSRKDTLVEHGFRLPSALDNRPLRFEEFEKQVGQVLYTSATPAAYERERSAKEGQVVEQIIRPTGLLDPELIVRPIVSSAGYEGQIKDFIHETERTIARGERVLVTTLTKKMAEDLSEFLKGKGVHAEYIHSDVKTIDRIDILTKFRKGEFDILVGVNLLREGLDLPEVSLVGILDADKEGFLRSATSLIQTIGRAARNVHGRVILYADEMTGSMRTAIDETNRRRATQATYNKKHHITPKTIQKAIKDITDTMRSEHDKVVGALLSVDRDLYRKNPKATIKEKTRQMTDAVKRLDFETAALLRDEIRALETSKKEK